MQRPVMKRPAVNLPVLRGRSAAMAGRLQREESGLTTLEWLGVAAVIITVIAFIPAARGLVGDAYDVIFKRID